MKQIFFVNTLALLIFFCPVLFANELEIPLGGIGTGKIEIMPNGGFGAFTLHQKPHDPIPNLGESFAAVYVNHDGKAIVKKLETDVPQGVESVRVEGFYPFETVIYEDQTLPVNVTLQAYSPMFIRDAKKSAVPGAVLEYQVENTSSSEIEAAIALSFQNILGANVGETVQYEVGEIRHEAFSSGSEHGVEMRFTPQNEEGARGSITIMAESERTDTVTILPVWEASNNEVWVAFNGGGEFVETGDRKITQPGTIASHPSSAVAVKRKIQPNSTSTFTFAIAWHSPTWFSTQGEKYTAYYNEEWDHSKKTASKLIDSDERNRDAMKKWSEAILTNELPSPIMASVMNSFKDLIRNSVYLDDGKFSLITGDQKWRGNLGSPEERLAAFPFFIQCFPDLMRSEMDVMMSLQLISGEASSYLGRAGDRVGAIDVDGAFLDRPVSTAAFVMLLYQYYLWTGDSDFIETAYPHIRSAIGWLVGQDETGDGVPDGESFMGDSQNGQLSLWDADCFLAALRVGEETGLLMKDLELQNQGYAARKRILPHVNSQLWNGTQYHAKFDPANPGKMDGETAFPGSWYTQLNGWYPHFFPQSIQTGLKSVSSNLKSNIHSWLNAALLTDYGYINRVINEQQQISQSMAAWSWYQRMTGVSLDVPRQALILSPRFMDNQVEMSFPLYTPILDGQVYAHRSMRTGIIECNIDFEQQWGDRFFKVNELAYAPMGGQDPNDFILHVIHNNEILRGQDFVREGLKIFRFTRPLQFSRGDQITMTVSPLHSGKVFANLDQGNIVNLGVNCTVETIRVSPEQLSFRLKNLQQENQLVRLETGGKNAADFSVYLNGSPVGSAADGVNTIPLFLRTSPVALREYTWLNYSRAGCIQTVQHIDQSNNQTVKKRLWELQEKIDQAYLADADLRGYQIDIVNAEAKLLPDPDDFEYDPRRVVRLIDNAKEELEDFLNDLPTITRDPVLAAEITGFFVPITINPTITNAGMLQEPFTVDVTVNNDARLEARTRLGIDVPEGWRFESKGMVEEQLDDSVLSFDTAFTVFPNEALQQQRHDFRLTLSGAWNNHAFRRYADLAVGHNFVKTWMVAGPFDNNGGQGFEQRFPLELNIKTEEIYKSGTRNIAWKEMTYPDGFVDFDTTFSPNDDAVGFAYVAVYSPREQRVDIHIGADEGVKVFHNYKEVYSKYRTSSMRPGTEKFGLRLFEGWNQVLVKVQDHQGVWGFFFEITDVFGRDLPDLQYALDRSKN